MSEEILHATIERTFGDLTKLHQIPFELPTYIQDNLNHSIRPYQEEALRHFIYTQRSDAADIAYNHLLFHMATGSGKTLVLAACILFLYKEKGHQNFIFFADSDAIVKKTRDNLTNDASPKYLFNSNGIVVDGESIQIQTVDVFPFNPAPNTIYLMVTSIQKLHKDLLEPRENGLTYDYLEDMKIVMLADEAHHYFAETKRDKKNLTKKQADAHSWERTIGTLLLLNSSNRLLGFSATFNLENELLFTKLQSKIVYQYDLKRFMESGYSKNVVLLQTNEDDEKKMLDAILLSQYRKYIAKDHGIDLKPIILYKSNSIPISHETNEKFNFMIENLTIRQLEETINKGLAIYDKSTSVWNKMYHYYKVMDVASVVRDLQWEFTSSETKLNANDAKFLSEGNTLLLNTLEQAGNPIRTIFAVAKLNEGWDVLNLYDIVRISERASNTITTTDSEAQLIGRGARYYPFVQNGEKSYQRRYDSVSSDLKVIETLHYHTLNESTYINNLNKSLEAAGIQTKKDGSTRFDAKIKAKFKNTDLYRNGKIFINHVIPTTPDDYRAFSNYQIMNRYESKYETSVEKEYGADKEVTVTRTHEIEWKPERKLLQKAIQRNPFYWFDNLKDYMPSITSIDGFIDSDNFLGGLVIELSLPVGLSDEDLSSIERLKIVEKFLMYAANKIRLNYMKLKGTPVFEGIRFTDMIQDYHVEINQVSGRPRTMGEVVKSKSMGDHDWYIFDQAIVNGLERDFIEFINDYMDRLQEQYEEVYLIRNERKVKVLEIEGTKGFMPDFLLYLKDENCTYQVFIEPKNYKLHFADQWKEDFLLSLSIDPDIEVLAENEDVRLLGIKFYSDNTEKRIEFKEDFKGKLLSESNESSGPLFTSD